MKGLRRALAISIALSILVPIPSPSSAAGLRLEQGNVKDFATRFERILSKTLDSLIPRLSDLRSSQGGREKLVSMSVRTGGGTVDVQGLGLLLPKPRRYDLTLKFSNVKEPATSGKELTVNGTLQLDFIAHGRNQADGLFRGVMRLDGRFSASPEVYGELLNGNIVALVTKVGNESFRVGKRKPRPFVSYTQTLAGDGYYSRGDADGTGHAARFNEPEGLVVAEDGTVYVADSGNDSIRKITPTGRVTTVATGLAEPTDVGIDADGNLIVSQLCSTGCYADDAPKKVPLARMDPSTGEHTPIVFNYNELGDDMCGTLLGHCDGRSPIGTMSWPNAVDVHGNVIYVAQAQYSASIRIVLPDGYLMTAHYSGGGRDGGDCGSAGILGGNSDVAKGINGEIYYLIPGAGCYGVLALQPDGSVRTVAGNLDEFGIQDGTGEEARFGPYPTDLVFDGIKYLYVSDSGNALIRRVDVTTGEVVRVAGCLSHEPGFDCTSQQGFRDGNGDRAMFEGPDGIALDQWGDLYLADRRNNAIRVIRVVTDPGRSPLIQSFQPFALEQGATDTIEVRGRNLGLAESASLGEGVEVTLQNAGARRVLLHTKVSPTAAPGPRTLSITTPYGTVRSPSGMSLEILASGISGAQVSTIAGTGRWAPGINDGSADTAHIGFPLGMATVDEERALVVDSLEQRVRMIATKKGAAEEIVDLMMHASEHRETLEKILSGLDKLGGILEAIGIENKLDNASPESLRPYAQQAIDQYCDLFDGDCTWLSLPWAGVPVQPGDTTGLRLEARLFLPTDVAKAGSEVYYVADAGNAKVKTVGLNPATDPPGDTPFELWQTHRMSPRPFTVGTFGDNEALVGQGQTSTIQKLALKSGGQYTDYVGIKNAMRCVPAANDDGHPMGVPLGMATTDEEIYVADAYCQTVWRIDKANKEVTDMRGDARQDGTDIGACSDGPVSFATFGAPVDVDVDSNGNIWVVDSVCNSIRVIKDLGKDDETIAAGLKEYLNGVAGHLPGAVADKIETKLDELDDEFLKTNKWWVITIAGSQDGDAGFADGTGAEALFRVPTGITLMERDDTIRVLVSDSGNQRIRMIEMPKI